MMRELRSNEVAIVNGGACEELGIALNNASAAFANMNPEDPNYFVAYANLEALQGAYAECLGNNMYPFGPPAPCYTWSFYLDPCFS
jgi:hypothetical protein